LVEQAISCTTLWLIRLFRKSTVKQHCKGNGKQYYNKVDVVRAVEYEFIKMYLTTGILKTNHDIIIKARGTLVKLINDHKIYI